MAAYHTTSMLYILVFIGLFFGTNFIDYPFFTDNVCRLGLDGIVSPLGFYPYTLLVVDQALCTYQIKKVIIDCMSVTTVICHKTT